MHILFMAALEPAVADEPEVDDVEVDCTAPCWRNVGPGGHECQCEESEAGTWSPGC